MRVLVLSDTHGHFSAFCAVLNQQPKADLVLFLGDTLQEYEDVQCLYPHRQILAVRGNNDHDFTVPIVRTLAPGGVRMVMTHGHMHGVYGGIGGLEKLAQEHDAKIVLYGHTHCGRIEYENGVYYINPGSASLPRDGHASYAYIDITPSGIMPVRVKLGGGVLQ